MLPRLPLTDEQKAAFPDIDPQLLDGMGVRCAGPDRRSMLRWSLIQRGFWVNGVDSSTTTSRISFASRFFRPRRKSRARHC